METIFFTGFPGFLGSELLPRVLGRASDTEAVCLVQPKFAALALRRVQELEAAHPALAGRIRVVGGDITAPDLGLGPSHARYASSSVEIFHLAAVYDLSVGRPLAMRVNVDGTRHVLDFARKCPALRRLQYVSTCYVSGRYDGVFGEDDLEKGQAFNNYYEETKYLAEVEVRRAMGQGLPATVYRPAIVVGDSTTGATQKYDGPYFGLRLLLRQARLAFLPVMGEPSKTQFNIVPRDFVVDSIAYLSAQAWSVGQTYNLADPEPLAVDELIDVMARLTGRWAIRVPLPLWAAKAALDRMPGAYRLLQIPSSALDYFVHPTRYATGKTQKALEAGRIRCPGFTEYAPRLVEFLRRHPDISAEAMV